MDEVQLKNLFGKRVRELRQSRGYTQEKLSELLWIDPQHFCKMENGNHFPTVKNLVNLANVLGVDVKDLFSYDNSEIDETVSKINFELKKLNQKELNYIYKMISALGDLS